MKSFSFEIEYAYCLGSVLSSFDIKLWLEVRRLEFHNLLSSVLGFLRTHTLAGMEEWNK